MIIGKYIQDKEISMTFDENYCLEQLKKLLDIDSTTGQFRQIQDYVCGEVRRLGYEPIETHKGGVIVIVILKSMLSLTRLSKTFSKGT